MTENQKRLAIGTLGAALGAGILYVGSMKTRAADDEDRPPIIVKNGSLEFEIDGQKKWKKHDHGAGRITWRMDHQNGKRVDRFLVQFDGGTLSVGGPCPTTSVTDKVTVNDEGKAFNVGAEPREKNGNYTGPNEAALSSATELTVKNDQTLMVDGDGSIDSVSFTTIKTTVAPAVAITCLKPTRAGIWPM